MVCYQMTYYFELDGKSTDSDGEKRETNRREKNSSLESRRSLVTENTIDDIDWRKEKKAQKIKRTRLNEDTARYHHRRPPIRLNDVCLMHATCISRSVFGPGC